MFKLNHGVALKDLEFSQHIYHKSGLDLDHLEDYTRATYSALLDAFTKSANDHPIMPLPSRALNAQEPFRNALT